MYRGKRIEVIFVGCANRCYSDLLAAVKKERATGTKNSDNQRLLNSIQRHVEILRNDPIYGRDVKKPLIPKIYQVQNLWIINLVGNWRMMYTLRHGIVEIQAVVLEVLDHKRYNERFGFRG